MILYIILAVACLVLTVYLFLIYNNGYGTIKSKRPYYAASLVLFIAFVFFSIKAYHYNDNKNHKQIFLEIFEELNELENSLLTKDVYRNTQTQEIQRGLKVIRSQIDIIEKALNDSNLHIYETRIIVMQIDSLLSIRNDTDSIDLAGFNSKIRVLVSSLESEPNKENETWFIIFISIICAFLIYALRFTFQNKILG